MLFNFSPAPDLRCWMIAALGFFSLLEICVVGISPNRFNGNKLLRCPQKAAAFPVLPKKRR
jgi:hypothetical protein